MPHIGEEIECLYPKFTDQVAVSEERKARDDNWAPQPLDVPFVKGDFIVDKVDSWGMWGDKWILEAIYAVMLFNSASGDNEHLAIYETQHAKDNKWGGRDKTTDNLAQVLRFRGVESTEGNRGLKELTGTDVYLLYCDLRSPWAWRLNQNPHRKWDGFGEYKKNEANRRAYHAHYGFTTHPCESERVRIYREVINLFKQSKQSKTS